MDSSEVGPWTSRKHPCQVKILDLVRTKVYTRFMARDVPSRSAVPLTRRTLRPEAGAALSRHGTEKRHSQPGSRLMCRMSVLVVAVIAWWNVSTGVGVRQEGAVPVVVLFGRGLESTYCGGYFRFGRDIVDLVVSGLIFVDILVLEYSRV